MTKRKRISEAVLADVLHNSRRRCCLCAFLLNDRSLKKGQIAHLDGDPENNASSNLVFLCFDHHDEYDSKTSTSKRLTRREVERYRELLYAENVQSRTEGRFTENFDRLSAALIAGLQSAVESLNGRVRLREQLSGLNRHLLRLETIIEEIGSLTPQDAEGLWCLAPSSATTTARHEQDASKLALLNRYLNIMSALALALQGTVRSMIQVEAPQVAEYLTTLWHVKVELLQAMGPEAGKGTLADEILSRENWLTLIEATRTFECHVLLQVVDTEARAVARDMKTGLTIFGELHRNRELLGQEVNHLRSELLSFIRECSSP